MNRSLSNEEKNKLPKVYREYLEKAANQVTLPPELKQKKKGGVVKGKEGVAVNRADEYPLEKLDNLLNFTNYNKPKAKSGGWLDKYN